MYQLENTKPEVVLNVLKEIAKEIGLIKTSVAMQVFILHMSKKKTDTPRFNSYQEKVIYGKDKELKLLIFA